MAQWKGPASKPGLFSFHYYTGTSMDKAFSSEEWVEPPLNEVSDRTMLTLAPTFDYAAYERTKTREQIFNDFRAVLDAAKRVPEPREPITVAEAEAQWASLRGPWKPSPAQVAADILNGVTPRHRPYTRT
jgi:hypothetical protein